MHCKEIDYLSGPDEVITLLKDETETVKANEESKQHERMLDNLFRNIPVGIELYDPEGSLRSINPKDCEIFGVRPDEVLGINIMDNPLVPEQVKEKIRNRQPVDFRLDYRFGLLSDYYNTSFEDRDTRKDIVAKYVPLYDGGNRLLYHLCIVIDNTDTVNIQNRIHDLLAGRRFCESRIWEIQFRYADWNGHSAVVPKSGRAGPFERAGGGRPGIPLCAPGGSQTHVCVLRCGPEP